MKRAFGRLRRDTDGAVLVEFALIAVMTFVLVGGLFDGFMAFWQWNSAMKAVERGARIAAVSNPVASGLQNLNAVGPGTPGDSYPTYSPSFTIRCDGAAATCTGAPAGSAVAYDATAMNDIVYGRGNASCVAGTSAYSVGMCNMYWQVTPANVVIEYRASDLGFYGRPGGPVVTVDLSLQNIRFQFFFLGGLLGFNDIILGTAKTSITSEDLSLAAP